MGGVWRQKQKMDGRGNRAGKGAKTGERIEAGTEWSDGASRVRQGRLDC